MSGHFATFSYSLIKLQEWDLLIVFEHEIQKANDVSPYLRLLPKYTTFLQFYEQIVSGTEM